MIRFGSLKKAGIPILGKQQSNGSNVHLVRMYSENMFPSSTITFNLQFSSLVSDAMLKYMSIIAENIAYINNNLD